MKRIDHPHKPYTGSEPLSDLVQYFPGPVCMRQDFGDPVRGHFGVPALGDLIQARLRHEGDIGRPDGVGITADFEPGVLGEHGAEVLCLDVVHDAVEQLRGGLAMRRAGRLANDQRAAHQLGGLAGFAEVEQILGGLDD